MEEGGRAAEAGLWGDRRAGRAASGTEDPLQRELLIVLPTGSRFSCKMALEVAGGAETWGVVSFPERLCSNTEQTLLLAQCRRERNGSGKGSGKEGEMVRKENKTEDNPPW